MKKTLIALAVAASAAVSGSAMAWTANGTGGSVDLGGTLTPADVVTPWEIKTGGRIDGLDVSIRKGATVVDVPVNKAIPVLGIRTVANTAFEGTPGISPQINYGDAVDLDGFNAGVTTVSMEVRDEQGNVIGGLVAPFFAGAETSQKAIDASNVTPNYKYSLFSNKAGNAFFGGLPKSSDGAVTNVSTKVNAIDSQFTANYNTQGVEDYRMTYGQTSFSNNEIFYSAFYGSGLRSGDTIKISLSQPVGADAITWKASLPITVSYQ
ncbi:TPA: hypothetical protein ACIBKF_003441 [Salmonella enterica subsp. enterica serovar 6,7:y:-]